MMNIKSKDKRFSTMCVFAIRYSLGRRTAAPTFTTSYVMDEISSIATESLESMKRDIEEAFRTNNIGDPCLDGLVWKTFLNKINREISLR